MDFEQKASAFIDELMQLYFERRDMDTLLTRMDARISWIGTGADELSHGLDQARQALEHELREYGGAFRLENANTTTVRLSEHTCVSYGTLRAVPLEHLVEAQELRITCVCEEQDGVLRLLHGHFSRPDCVQETGRYYVQEAERASNSVLRNELENLTRNIPGGAHQCKNDPNFTLMNMSDGFLSMFGYSREEIRRRFDDKFINMIYPGDRAEILRNTREQLRDSSTIDLEYRVLCADGTLMWILDKGQLLNAGQKDECFYCILIDITQRKWDQEELRLSLERHQVIMDQATDIIFEWDIRKDTLSFSPNWQKKFGYEAISASISSSIPLSKNIHPDDISAFIQIMRDTAAGVPYSETEFRIKDVTGRYYWCRIRATAQYDAENRPIKAVGVILDVDAEKKQKQALLDQAQRDALTGLYNKTAINSLVEQRIEGISTVGCQALMILDVDNFKSVNDTFGHLAGDNVLSDVAAALKESVRSTDLVGRIGGDEFLVYFSEVVDTQAVLAKAEHILTQLHTITPTPSAGAITCSAGVAVFPHGAADYRTLYQCADQALYHRKQNGRQGVSLYDSAMPELPCRESHSVLGTEIVSDEGSVRDEQLPQYVFRTLYDAKDTYVAIKRLLEIIGRAYDVSRAYVFESSPDGKRSSITFEWCAAGVPPQLDSLQDLSYEEDLGDYQQNFDLNGVFYCGDINAVSPDLRAVLEPQGIRSMLQCAILDEGRFVGGVGFDECRENRHWSEKQVASFKLTANVMASFLLKQRLKEQLRQRG